MSSPGLEHVGEPKECVGIYVIIPNGPDAGSLTDLGWRFYIDPNEHEVFAFSLEPADQDYVDGLLQFVKDTSQARNPEMLLQWCLGYANMFNVLGTLRAFADPSVVRDGALDPASQSVSDALHQRGM